MKMQALIIVLFAELATWVIFFFFIVLNQCLILCYI